MAVLEHVELAVDGGGVTVARRLAYYSYGKFDVVLPEDREQVEFDDRIQNAYISRSPGASMGRFDFGFIRADATVNLESGTSDLELAIDSTSKRSEGDVFVERDVSPAGFRGHRPGVDFDLDDLVFLRVWGNRLRLPVTAIDMSASISDGPHASRVHLGGQLVSDGETRRRANNEVLLQIAQEKRQRLRQVKAADSKASSAVSKADAAQSAADAVRSDFDALKLRVERDAQVVAESISRTVSQADFETYDGKLQSRLWGAQGEFNKITAEFQAKQEIINLQQAEINRQRQQFEAQQKLINDQQKQINSQNSLISSNQAKTLAEIARTQISATAVTRNTSQSIMDFGTCRVTNSYVKIDFVKGWSGHVVGIINIEAGNNYSTSFSVHTYGNGETKTVLESLPFQSFNDALFIAIPS
ncbi:hypothetical protein ACOJAK_11820 [Corynebacterium striatum]|uniref:hypothetical protein n=1 Tax=Corynebacterium striatum TaxID=43770 RepID=UPI003B5CAE7C